MIAHHAINVEDEGLGRGGGLRLHHLVTGGFHSGGQLFGRVGHRHGEGGGVFGQAYLGGDTGEGFQSGFDPADTVIAHHAINMEDEGLGRGGSGGSLGFGGGSSSLREEGAFHLGDGREGICGGELRFPAAQPQGIADDADRGKAHGGGGQHGAELPAQQGIEHPGGNGNADAIIKECPEEVLLDIAQDAAGKLQGGGNIGGVAVHEDNIGGVDGDIGAGTDGDADIGPDQCGGVIDAIADHGDDLPLFLQGADDRFLLLGQHLRDDPGNADLLGNGFGCTAVITGEQQYRKTHLPQGGNGSGTGFPGRIGDGDEPQGGGANAEIQRGASPGGKLLRRGGKSGDIAAHGGGQAGIAAPDRFAVQFCGKALSLRRGEIGDGGEGDILFCTVGGDGGS